MRVFRGLGVAVYTNEELLEYPIETESEVRIFTYRKLENLLSGRDDLREFTEIFNDFGQFEESYAILHTHGALKDGKWAYVDDAGKAHLVQNWIKGMDGKYGTLILAVCADQDQVPSSKKSLLLVPDADASMGHTMRGEWVTSSALDLYHPKEGRVDSYVIDALVRDLKEQVEKRKQESVLAPAA